MKNPTLKIPEGYQPPEGIEAGQSFDESVTFILREGKLELTAINGISLSEKPEGEKAQAQPGDTGDAGLASRYAAAMNAAQA